MGPYHRTKRVSSGIGRTRLNVLSTSPSTEREAASSRVTPRESPAPGDFVNAGSRPALDQARRPMEGPVADRGTLVRSTPTDRPAAHCERNVQGSRGWSSGGRAEASARRTARLVQRDSSVWVQMRWMTWA